MLAQPGNLWRLMRPSLALTLCPERACVLAEPCASHASLLIPANMSWNAGYPTYVLGTGYAGVKRSAPECQIKRS